MLTPDDRRAIEELFAKLDDVGRNSGQRDPEAERFIEDKIAQQPGAAYYMAQTIVVQEAALREAREKIETLEGDRPAPGRNPWQRNSDPDGPRRGRSGGFLAGAAQTALGVTGGVLLGSAIASLFGGGGAQAEEVPAEDAGADQGDGGGWDDGGGFDMGGDF